MEDPAYRISHSFTHESALLTNPRVIYHSLYPQPALSPVPDAATPLTVAEQSEHETQYRQLLVQSALAVLLPTEDLENACLRTLVADVLAESILGNAIGGKSSEGYFIWETITKIVTLVKTRIQPKVTGKEIEVDTRSRLEKFGLLSERSEATGKFPPFRPLSGWSSNTSTCYLLPFNSSYMVSLRRHLGLRDQHRHLTERQHHHCQNPSKRTGQLVLCSSLDASRSSPPSLIFPSVCLGSRDHCLYSNTISPEFLSSAPQTEYSTSKSAYRLFCDTVGCAAPADSCAAVIPRMSIQSDDLEVYACGRCKDPWLTDYGPLNGLSHPFPRYRPAFAD